MGVKLAKRLIADNGENSDINRDEVSRALLQYLNTPLRDSFWAPHQMFPPLPTPSRCVESPEGCQGGGNGEAEGGELGQTEQEAK